MGKLSGFKKFVGNLGRKIFYWKEEKYPINILAVMMEAVITEYAKIHDGNYVIALENLDEILGPAGEDLVHSMLLEPIVMGRAFSDFMTDDLDDLPWLISTSLYALFGNKGYKIIFGKKGVNLLSETESEEGVTTLVLTFQKCPFCANVSVTQEDLGDKSYGVILESLFGKMVEVIQESVGNDYRVFSLETKCFLRGDDVGEYRIWLYPGDATEEQIRSNPFLKDMEIPVKDKFE